MELFSPVTTGDKLHPIFKLISKPEYQAERDVLNDWAKDFLDRDGKFIHEFQTTFESSMWELYLHALLKELGASIDFTHHAPDFVANLDRDICLEATIAAPAQNGPSPFGHSSEDIPEDLSEFNRQAVLRLCNSLSSKIRKYRDSYSKLSHVEGKPYVIGLASFDRPFSHLAGHRPIMTALYGVYFDEEATIESGSETVIQIPVDGVVKNESSTVPVGYFQSDEFSEVSAVIYSSLATWGKIRALADDDSAMSIYTSYHPPVDGTLIPEIKRMKKCDYEEHLVDGLHIFHNPFAEHPLGVETFNHERVAQYFIDRENGLEIIAPDDFLLLRHLQSLTYKSSTK